VSIAGGVRVEEPAADLGIALAIASSYWDVPLDGGTVVFGEIGLGGEIRRVTHAGKRAQEAARLGYSRIVLPSGSLPRAERPEGVEILEVDRIGDAIDLLMDRGLRSPPRERSGVGAEDGGYDDGSLP